MFQRGDKNKRKDLRFSRPAFFASSSQQFAVTFFDDTKVLLLSYRQENSPTHSLKQRSFSETFILTLWCYFLLVCGFVCLFLKNIDFSIIQVLEMALMMALRKF